MFRPPCLFSSKEAAEGFGREFAKDYIDQRTKFRPAGTENKQRGKPEEITQRMDELARRKEIAQELSELCDMMAALEAQKH
jgi:hypothetical protein